MKHTLLIYVMYSQQIEAILHYLTNFEFEAVGYILLSMCSPFVIGIKQ